MSPSLMGQVGIHRQVPGPAEAVQNCRWEGAAPHVGILAKTVAAVKAVTPPQNYFPHSAEPSRAICVQGLLQYD
jgi:hypothetical protein